MKQIVFSIDEEDYSILYEMMEKHVFGFNNRSLAEAFKTLGKEKVVEAQIKSLIYDKVEEFKRLYPSV